MYKKVHEVVKKLCTFSGAAKHSEVLAGVACCWTQNQSEQHGKPVQLPVVLWQYQFTTGSNNNWWLTEATGMYTNGCNMLSGSNFALFLDNGGCCGSAWGQNEELEML